MSEKYYVEDYIKEEELIAAVQQSNTGVEVLESKEDRIKLKVFTHVGEKIIEKTIEVKEPLMRLEIPKLDTISTNAQELIEFFLALQPKIRALRKVSDLIDVTFPIQADIWAFSIEKPAYLTLPFLPHVHSWHSQRFSYLLFPRQYRVLASSNLLRLLDATLLKLPVTSNITASIKIPEMEMIKLNKENPVQATFTSEFELKSATEEQSLKNINLLYFIVEEEDMRRFSELSNSYVGEPIIIILRELEEPKELWYLFWLICRELYRESQGGFPEPVILSKKNITLWLRLFGKISSKVVIMHENDIKNNEELLRIRLQEAFSQGLGFLIIIAKDVHKTENLIENLAKPYRPRIIKILASEPKDKIINKLYKVFTATFGNIFERLEEELPVKFKQIDDLVSFVDNAYKSFINEMLSSCSVEKVYDKR